MRWNRKIIMVISCIIVFLMSLACQIGMHFTLHALKWANFKKIWWQGPDIVLFEWVLIEIFFDIPHVIIGRMIVNNKKRFGKKRKCMQWFVAGCVMDYLGSY